MLRAIGPSISRMSGHPFRATQKQHYSREYTDNMMYAKEIGKGNRKETENYHPNRHLTAKKEKLSISNGSKWSYSESVSALYQRGVQPTKKNLASKADKNRTPFQHYGE